LGEESFSRKSEHKIIPNRNHTKKFRTLWQILVLCQHPGTTTELMVIEYHHGYRILLGIWHWVL